VNFIGCLFNSLSAKRSVCVVGADCQMLVIHCVQQVQTVLDAFSLNGNFSVSELHISDTVVCEILLVSPVVYMYLRINV